MPYIEQGERPGIDELVDPLADMLNAATAGSAGNDAMVGKLNYAVSRLAWRLCGHGAGERRYARMNAVGGALAMAAQEFYRRIAAPYEDEKIAQAGDVSVLRSPSPS
jgi:hypothetical protein